MTTKTNQGTALDAEKDFDNHAQKGWNNFTKFLLSNVVMTAGALIIIGIFTVWS